MINSELHIPRRENLKSQLELLIDTADEAYTYHWALKGYKL
jgi:hypothetical protein